MQVELGVIKIDIREDNSDESFGLVQTILEGFHVLWGRIPATIRRLVVGAF